MATTPSATAGITFKLADTNHTGKVSWKELHAALPGITPRQFKTADKDHNNRLNAAEFGSLPGSKS